MMAMTVNTEQSLVLVEFRFQHEVTFFTQPLEGSATPTKNRSRLLISVRRFISSLTRLNKLSIWSFMI